MLARVRQSLKTAAEELFPSDEVELIESDADFKTELKGRGSPDIGPFDAVNIIERRGGEKAGWSTLMYCRWQGYVVAVRVSSPPNLTMRDLRVAEAFMRVFQTDVALAAVDNDEPWGSLRSTQMRRAVASAIGAEGGVGAQLLGAIESAAQLTYEGKQFCPTIFVTSDVAGLTARFGSCYVKFREELETQRALLGEKWVRAVVEGDRVALVATPGESSMIPGVLSLRNLPAPDRRKQRYSPHSDIVDLHLHLVRDEAAVVVGNRGDIFALGGVGSVFLRRQGRWRSSNYMRLHYALQNSGVDDGIATSVLRMAFDLSFEGGSALLVVLHERTSRDALVLDAGTFFKTRVNAALRRAARGLRIEQKSSRDLLTSAATVDGAVLVDKAGVVVDVACMVRSDARPANWLAGRALPVHGGARTNAAVVASLFGVAIKISADGPITVWVDGTLVASAG